MVALRAALFRRRRRHGFLRAASLLRAQWAFSEQGPSALELATRPTYRLRLLGDHADRAPHLDRLVRDHILKGLISTIRSCRPGTISVTSHVSELSVAPQANAGNRPALTADDLPMPLGRRVLIAAPQRKVPRARELGSWRSRSCRDPRRQDRVVDPVRATRRRQYSGRLAALGGQEPQWPTAARRLLSEESRRAQGPARNR